MSQVGSERGTSRRRGRRTASVGLCALALSAARCTFPDFHVDDHLGGGGTVSGSTSLGGAQSGNGGTAGASAGSGAQAGTSVVMGGMAGDAGMAGESGAPACPFESWPVDRCAGGCLEHYADHCYDGTQSGDEIAPDCGGSCQACSNEACTQDADCLSGRCDPTGMTCYAPLTMQVVHHELSFSVGSLAFSLNLKNNEPDGGQAFSLKDVEVRYYLERSGVTEPILVRATQSNLQQVGGANMELKQTTWELVHTQEQSGAQYDAYLSVHFADPVKLYPGDQVSLYQQIIDGDPANSTFDQRSDYSFSKDPESVSPHTTVFNQGKLIWGLEPGPVSPRACFARGVNLNGPGVTINGASFQGSDDAQVTTTGTLAGGGAPYPSVPAGSGLATLLSEVIQLQAGQDLTLPVDNASYLVHLYVTSPGSDATASELTIQGMEPASFRFRSQSSDGGQAWAKMGPFPVTVSDGNLKVGVSAGTMAFAGIELDYPE